MSKVADHTANERTYLAWIRTSIGIMAFGFVVEKFSLFMKQLLAFLEVSRQSDLPKLTNTLPNYFSYIGTIFVAFGTIVCVFAFIKYLRVAKQIESDNYKPTFLLDSLLTFVVFLIGVFLVVSLV